MDILLGVLIDVWFEFVDPSGNGNYRISIHPDEKIKPEQSQ
jgi:hypothetical protein